MNTERMLLKKFISTIVSVDDDTLEKYTDRIIGIFDQTRPIKKSSFLEAALVGIDLSGYPEDVADVLLVICEKWNLKPPKNKKDKAFWIEDAKRIKDSCGEIGTNVLLELRNDFEKYMSEHCGIAPFTVEGPGSLVKVSRSKAGEIRGRKINTIVQTEDGGIYV